MICSHTSAFGVSDLYEAYKCAIKASCYGNRVSYKKRESRGLCVSRHVSAEHFTNPHDVLDPGTFY